MKAAMYDFPKLLLIILSLLTILPNLAAAQQKIEVVYTGVADCLPVFYAKDKGIFERNGLDATITRTSFTPQIIPVLYSGTAQIGMTTAPHLLQAVEKGLDLVVVSGGTRISSKHPTISLVVKKGISFSSANDARGLKIGVPGILGMVDVVFRDWLVKKGVNPKDVTIVEVSVPKMADLLAAGTVDAVTAIEPIRSRIITRDVGSIGAEFFSEINADSVGVIWIATRQWASTNKEITAKFKAALAEANEMIAKNPEDAKAIELSYLKINSPHLPTTRTEVSIDDLKFFADLLARYGQLSDKVDVPSILKF